MKSTPTAARGEKRPLILRAATEVFAEQGFNSVTVAAIADRAGIGKGTVYEYFSSKDELLFAVFEWMNEGIFDRIHGLIEVGGTTLERLRGLLDLGAEITREQLEMQAVVLDFWSASRGTKSRSATTRHASRPSVPTAGCSPMSSVRVRLRARFDPMSIPRRSRPWWSPPWTGSGSRSSSTANSIPTPPSPALAMYSSPVSR